MMISEPKDAAPTQRTEDVNGSATRPGKLLRCPQEGCGKVFRSSPGYRYHLKSHTLDPRPHVCQCCHKKFKSANGLKYHLRKAHHIEPVLAKQNLGGTSPKGRDSISSEEEHYISLSDSYPRGFLNGNYSERLPSVTSPVVKSPLALTSPLTKNLPGVPSPLVKNSMDMPPYLSSGSSVSSPFAKNDRYLQYYDRDLVPRSNGEYPRRFSEYGRLNSGEFSPYCTRSSLSEYTQQCQQANNEFRQQIQRLSSGDFSHRLSPVEYSSQRSSCEFYNRKKSDSFPHSNSSTGSLGYHRNNSIDFNRSEPLHYSSCGEKELLGSREDYSPYTSNGFKDFPIPSEGKEYPTNLNHNPSCSMSHVKLNLKNNSSCGAIRTEQTLQSAGSTASDLTQFKVPCSVQNTEQIVPDISVPNVTSPTLSDQNNNNNALKNIRGASESSTETELSDCVFQNENSNPASSPQPKQSRVMSPVITFKDDSLDLTLQPPPSKPLLSRRTSRTKSIPPALVIHPSPQETTNKAKDMNKFHLSNKLLHLAEIATSPRSPFNNSPLPLSLTPSMLPSDATPDWVKSPISKFLFPEKQFLSTPTIARCNTSDIAHTTSPIVTSSHSLPLSPFLDNVQTPSFWPTQVWPTPVWLCFLRGCTVKFEQDDKAFMKTEEVAAYCTTPGGRRRDDMNFYTSGMKIVEIQEEKPSVNTARDMVQLTFEQIIPGPQRLVAKCPIDHPFYIRHKGWSASSPTEAMARYGIPFRTLHCNDICVQAPKLNQTPGNTLSPIITSATAPQIFTFSPQDTSRFSSQSKRPELTKIVASVTPPHECCKLQPCNKPATVTGKEETITLTYSSKTPEELKSSLYAQKQKLADALKASSEAASKYSDNNVIKSETVECSSQNTQQVTIEDIANKINPVPRKKRRKPLQGNEDNRRPMNGFMLFAKSMRIELTKIYPGKDNRAISKLLGERWRELCEEKREDFSRMAKEMADERMKVNPDCWKRKHRKEPGIKAISSDNESPESKKIKFSPDISNNSFTLPAPFTEAHIVIKEEEVYS